MTRIECPDGSGATACYDFDNARTLGETLADLIDYRDRAEARCREEIPR